MADVTMAEAVAVAGAALYGGCDGAAPAKGHHSDANPPATDAVPYGPGPGAYDPGRYQPNSDSDERHPNRDLDAVANHMRVPRDAGRALDHALDAAGAGLGSQGRDGDAVEVQAVTYATHGGLGCDALPECGHRGEGVVGRITFASTVPEDPWATLYAGHGPASLPDAIERIRAERDILRRRVEERAHDCTNVEAERDRLRSDIATLGTVEMMVRNPNIDSWVREHEAELETSRVANAHLIDLNVKLIEERDRLRELVREVSCSAAEFEDERVRCVAIQIDRETWEQVKASASQADLSGGAVFSGPPEPSSSHHEPERCYPTSGRLISASPVFRGLTPAEGGGYEALLAESFGGTYDEEAGP